MNNKLLLKRYLKMVFESNALARVPTQLLPTDSNGNGEDCKCNDKDKDSLEDEDGMVKEFSAVGGMSPGMGYTAPLGGNKKKRK